MCQLLGSSSLPANAPPARASANRWFEAIDVAVAAAISLPRAEPPHDFGHTLVKRAVQAEHEDVHVGDGAEGLVAQR
jgi:hypothetical protein